METGKQETSNSLTPSWNERLISFFHHPSLVPNFLLHSSDAEDVMKRIREELLASISLESNSVDKADIEMIKSSEDYILRFLLNCCGSNNNLTSDEVIRKTANQMTKTLKWRKEVGFSKIASTHFPREFYLMKPKPWVGNDGRFYSVCNLRYHYKNDKLFNAFEEEKVYQAEVEYENIRRQYKRGFVDMKPVLIMDFRGAGMSQVDMTFVTSNKANMLEHFPSTLFEIIIVGLPSWLKVTFNLFLRLAPSEYREKCKVMQMTELLSYFGKENLPAWLGGTLVYPEVDIRKHPSIEDVMRERGFQDKEIDAYLSHLEKATRKDSQSMMM